MNGAQCDLTTARQIRWNPLVGLGTSLPSKERRDFDLYMQILRGSPQFTGNRYSAGTSGEGSEPFLFTQLF